MAYYARKITRSKWGLLDKNDKDVIGNYKADTIANDIRTKGNTISLWKMEDICSASCLEQVVVINSLLGDTIQDFDLLIISEDLLEPFTIEQEDGDTVVTNFKNLHYNIINLTVRKQIQFANDVVLKIVKQENLMASDKNWSKRILKIRARQQKPIIKKWIDNREIDFNQLKEKQKIALQKEYQDLVSLP